MGGIRKGTTGSPYGGFTSGKGVCSVNSYTVPSDRTWKVPRTGDSETPAKIDADVEGRNVRTTTKP